MRTWPCSLVQAWDLCWDKGQVYLSKRYVVLFLNVSVTLSLHFDMISSPFNLHSFIHFYTIGRVTNRLRGHQCGGLPRLCFICRLGHRGPV